MTREIIPLMPYNVDHLRFPGFRFREKQIALILSGWTDGHSILLTGIRRTGKSRLTKKALVQHADAGGQIGFLDVQNLTNLHDFYSEILKEMPNDLLNQLGELLKSLKTVPDKILEWIKTHVVKTTVAGQVIEFQPADSLPRYWEPIVAALGDILRKHDSQKLPILGIDELPFMLENLIGQGVSDNELRVAMASLRKLRDAGLRMIISGSISMENLLTLRGIPHTVLGGLVRVNVPPFSREEARLYLKEKLTGTFAQAPNIIELTLDTLPDFVPSFLEEAVRYLLRVSNIGQCTKTLRDDILPAIRRSFLRQFEERLVKNYLGTHLAIAERILDDIARADADGTRLDTSALPEGHRRVKQMLQRDDFIVEGPDYRWLFSLNFLRQWWRADRGIA